MSRPVQHTITCDECGSEQPFTAWESLNADLNRQQKTELLNGDLTRFTCAKCGATSDVVYPLLYHDMDKLFMVWLIPGGGGDPGTIGEADDMEEYQFRLVNTRNELLEKIRIFDSGFDDRLIELFKAVLQAQSSEHGTPLNGELFFASASQDEDGASLHFELLKPEGVQGVKVFRSSFDQVARALGRHVPPVGDEMGKWLRVDLAYAIAVMEKGFGTHSE